MSDSRHPYNGQDAPIPVPDIENWNLDRSVSVPTKVRGNMWKTSGGSWVYDAKPSSFQISTVGMSAQGQDYSCLLPEDTKMVQMQIRGLNGNVVSCASTSAVSASPYFVLWDSQPETLGGHGSNFIEQSLWFSGSASDMTMELVIYK